MIPHLANFRRAVDRKDGHRDKASEIEAGATDSRAAMKQRKQTCRSNSNSIFSIPFSKFKITFAYLHKH